MEKLNKSLFIWVLVMISLALVNAFLGSPEQAGPVSERPVDVHGQEKFPEVIPVGLQPPPVRIYLPTLLANAAPG